MRSLAKYTTTSAKYICILGFYMCEFSRGITTLNQKSMGFVAELTDCNIFHVLSIIIKYECAYFSFRFDDDGYTDIDIKTRYPRIYSRKQQVRPTDMYINSLPYSSHFLSLHASWV